MGIMNSMYINLVITLPEKQYGYHYDTMKQFIDVKLTEKIKRGIIWDIASINIINNQSVGQLRNQLNSEKNI